MIVIKVEKKKLLQWDSTCRLLHSNSISIPTTYPLHHGSLHMMSVKYYSYLQQERRRLTIHANMLPIVGENTNYLFHNALVHDDSSALPGHFTRAIAMSTQACHRFFKL